VTPFLAMALIASAPGPAAAPRPPVHVDADEVQYQYKERRAIFLGKPLVRLTREDAVLTCRKLVTDNDEQGKVRRAVCTGDVKLTRGTKVATCQTATYDDATSRVVCVGNPVLKDGESVMTGEELVYDLAEDQVVMSRAKGTMVPKPGEEPVPRGGRKGGAK
jgi:lipopolysaccharide export system protein LptA